MRPPPRSERRAAWARANAIRPEFIDQTVEPEARTRVGRRAWGASGFRLPLLRPLQAHALSRHGRIGGPRTVAVQVGFNRAQRRALWAKKGPRRMLEHGRETATPAESFLPGKGAWNKFALRVEFQRRLAALQERQRRHNAWYRKAGRVAAAWWWFLKFTVRFAWASLKTRLAR